MTGLQPQAFTWVIKDRLAISERIGGYGLQHRRVRREEEIAWLQAAGFTAVLSLLDGNQNLAAYREAGLAAHHLPLPGPAADEDARRFGERVARILAAPSSVLLIHRDTIDDTLVGLLGGFLLHSGMVEDPLVATQLIQEIVGRALGPEGRRLIAGPVG